VHGRGAVHYSKNAGADGNISLQKIAKALGHTSTRMAGHYARPVEHAVREITKALDDDALLPKSWSPRSAPTATLRH
jgi:hypothetical protein